MQDLRRNIYIYLLLAKCKDYYLVFSNSLRKAKMSIGNHGWRIKRVGF